MSYFIIKTDYIYLNFNSSFFENYTDVYIRFLKHVYQEVWFLYRNANHSKFFKLRSKITKNMLQTHHPTPTPGDFLDPRM